MDVTLDEFSGPARRMLPKTQRAGLRVMLAYVRPHIPALVLGGFLSAATAATGLALPLVVRALIGDLSHHRALLAVIAAMCILTVADALLGAIGNYVLMRTAESIVLTARRHIIDRIIRLTIGALDRSEPGDLMSRATVDTTLLRNATSGALVGFIVGTLTLVATVVLMALIDPLLLGVSLAALAFAAVMMGIVVPKIGRATRHAQMSVGVMNSALERMLGAFRTVKASGAEEREGARVQQAAVEAWQSNLRAVKWQAVVSNAAQLSVQVAFLAVLATGGGQVASGTISVGTLVAFLLYVFYLMAPIQQLMNAVSQYQVGAAAVTRLQETELLPVEPAWDADPSTLPADTASADVPAGAASIEFKEVRFAYGPELPEVHHGVSFVVPPGGMTAFVGPSGAGKTTVFSLIERFYEPDSGQVLIDGVDIRDWPVASLRAAMGYVEQDAPVLSGTLRENLVFGAPEATPAELDEMLRVSRLSEMVERLPEGLETYVGHRGTRLSGGERQRVAIARALLRRPRLLLLDEATSQLDAINEAALRETVVEAARITTVLVVAHRLSTVTIADRIIVMDAGSVQAMGTHAELVATNPLYAELAATQFLVTSS